MKLDRNLNADGRGKYGLILQRRIKQIEELHGIANGSAGYAVHEALKVLQSFGVIDWGDTVDTEFFVIRLRDKLACPALRAYAIAAFDYDPDYAEDVFTLANRAGIHHPNAKVPD